LQLLHIGIAWTFSIFRSSVSQLQRTFIDFIDDDSSGLATDSTFEKSLN